MMSSVFLGTGFYVPDRVVTNQDLTLLMDTSDEWIRERTGIRERRMAAPYEVTSDLALEASRRALEAAGWQPEDITALIVATISPDMPMPATACLLQAKLGATRAAAFDISAACSGFIYGLQIADGFIRSGIHERVLVVGAEILSRVTDWQDRTTCVLFADGAGAAALRAAESEERGRGIRSVSIRSDGNLWDLLYIPGGGTQTPQSERVVADRLQFIKMKGNETFKVAVRTLEMLVVETLRDNGMEAADLALLIPHQANIRIIQATAERLGLSMDKVMINLDLVGNTSGASIPIALDQAVRTGRVTPGDHVLLEAFGAGLTWGSALVTI